jgi:hypothetical protein
MRLRQIYSGPVLLLLPTCDFTKGPRIADSDSDGLGLGNERLNLTGENSTGS